MSNTHPPETPADEKYVSFFRTTVHNQWLYWLTNLVILPTTLIVFYLTIGQLVNLAQVNVQGLHGLFVLAGSCVLAVFIDHSSNDKHWQVVSRPRWIVFAVCLIAMIYLLDNESTRFTLVFIFAIVGLTEWCLLHKYWNNKYRNEFWRLGLVLILFLLLVGLIFGIAGFQKNMLQMPLQSNISQMISALIRIAVTPFALASEQPNILKTIPILVFLVITAVDVVFPYTRSLAFVRWRNLTSSIRHDRLRSQVSPKHAPENPFNRLRDFLVRIVRYRQLYLILLFLIGLVGFPFLAWWVIFRQAKSLRSIMPPPTVSLELSSFNVIIVGLIGGFTLAFIYWIYYQLKSRQKYIVMPFIAIGETEGELQALAHLTTNAVVSELQHIGELMTLRQIENATNTVSDEAYALFITSGQEQEFIRQMQSLANLEVHAGNVKVPLGRMLPNIIQSLAIVRVKGTLQRRQNNTVEIWVELNLRDRYTVAVDTIFIPEDSTSDLDEITINKVVRQLVIKLIIELGQGFHLPTVVESFDYFLSGLEASSQRHWLQAIAYYRRAVEVEEALQVTFGIGHYHLGAALVFQGDYENGLRHLRLAENSGPPLAETQYMLALVQLYRYWDQLHNNRAVFKSIEQHCYNSLKLRNRFPEARHLLGATFYRRGRLQERDATRRYEIEPKQQRANYAYNYKQATRHFKLAVKQYDKQRTHIINSSRSVQRQQNGLQRNVRNRVTATHQLADSLRARRLGAEADTYYEDALIAFPRNIRTLVDLAKTYCISGLWQRADEFMRRRILRLEEARWDADVRFYRGWALAGGVEYMSKLGRLTKWSDTKSRNYVQELGHSLWSIDFAIHQRPRYVARWEQNDWLRSFEGALSNLEAVQDKNEIESDRSNLYRKTFKNSKPADSLFWMRQWLGWRINGYIYKDKDDNREITIQQSELIGKLLKNEQPSDDKSYERWLSCFDALRNIRKDITNILRELDQDTHINELQRERLLLTMGAKLQEVLNTTKEEFKKLRSNNEGTEIESGELQSNSGKFRLNLIERWAVDIYAETAILTVRILIKAKAYNHAYNAASNASQMLDQWRDQWQDELGENPGKNLGDNRFYFSQYVFRYQLASLHAWASFALFQQNFDEVTRVRFGIDNGFSEIQSELDKALGLMLLHPLALFVKAQLLRRQNLLSLASVELNHLLKTVAPFDPFKHMFNWDSQQRPRSSAKSRSIRTRLDNLARVSGRRQFEDIVDESSLHLVLADNFFQIGESQSGIQHLLSALASASPHQQDPGNFLKLITRLNLLERFSEAQAVIEAIRIPRYETGEVTFQIPYHIDIIESIVNMRRGNFGDAYETAQMIARDLLLFPFLQVSNHSTVEIEGASEAETTDSEQSTNPWEDNSYYSKLVEDSTKLTDLALNQILDSLRKLVESCRSDTNDLLQKKEDKRLQQIEPEPLLIADKPKKNTIITTKAIPQIFRRLLAQDDSLTDTIILATFRLLFSVRNPERDRLLQALHNRLNKLLDELVPTDTSADVLQGVFNGQILLMILNHALRQLELFAELCNVLAYTKAQLDLRLNLAYEDGRHAILIMGYLVDLVSYDSKQDRFIQYRENLALYYDTLGWVHYRAANHFANPAEHGAIQGKVTNYSADSDENEITRENVDESSNTIKYLSIAQRLLEEYGLKYDTKKAIIHYHLSRIHMTRLENLWQQIEKEENEIARHSSQIDMHLRKSYRHWRAAQQFDKVKRLHTRLTWLRKRNEDYRNAWHRRQLRLFRGEKDHPF